jgi:hypothetical protein
MKSDLTGHLSSHLGWCEFEAQNAGGYNRPASLNRWRKPSLGRGINGGFG